MFEEIKSVLETEWPVITGAPIIILVLVAVVGLVVWKLRGTFSQGKIEALEERLRLAADRYQQLGETKSKLEADITTVRRQIQAITDRPLRVALMDTSSSMQSHVVVFDSQWGKLGTTIAAPGAVGYELSAIIKSTKDEKKG